MTSNVVDRQKRFERVNADVLENGGKNSVLKNIRIRVDRQKRFENATVDADFFETGDVYVCCFGLHLLIC